MLSRHTVQQFEDKVYLLISHNLKENRYSIAHLPVASDFSSPVEKETRILENLRKFKTKHFVIVQLHN